MMHVSFNLLLPFKHPDCIHMEMSSLSLKANTLDGSIKTDMIASIDVIENGRILISEFAIKGDLQIWEFLLFRLLCGIH